MEKILNIFKKKTIKDVAANHICKILHGGKYGFHTHTVVTDDGYELNFFRLTVDGAFGAGEPVLLQHGLIDSSDSWILNEGQKSPAYFLLSNGFDVWLGNNRGNKYCKTHVNETINDKQFWDFSFQEMGRFDQPAMIKEILSVTGKAKLAYIGHSQGTSQMFAALTCPHTSEFMNSKVSVFIALAPVVYLANQTNGMLTDLCSTNFEKAAKVVGVYEMLPGNQTFMSNLGHSIQSSLFKTFPKLSEHVHALSDEDPEYNNTSRHHIFVKHHPAGSSLRCFEHFKQMIVQDKANPVFRKFDFGKARNLKDYGQEEPLEFDLSLINIPVRGFVGRQDRLSTPEDNQILYRNLRALGKNYRMLEFDKCGHLTFMWGNNVSEMFDSILAILLSVQE